MVDVAIAGHLGSEHYIGAIALGTMIFNLIYWNFGFLRMGTSGFTAQAYGAVDKVEIIHILARALCIALFAAFLLIALQYPIKHLAFYLVNGSQTVEDYAATYFSICIWGAPAILCLYALKGWFIGMQNAQLPMLIAIQINVINIALNFIFVIFFHWNIQGIALSSVVAQYAGLVTALILWFVHYRKYLHLLVWKQVINYPKMIHFFKTNVDIFLRTLCLIAVFTFIPAEGAKMGDKTLAVNTLLMQFFTLFSYIMDGFAYAGESLTGKYIGAKNPVLLKKSVRYLFRWGALLTLLFSIMYAFFGKYLLNVFTNDNSIINEAQTYFYWVLILPIAGFSAFLWDGILIGATAAKIMRNSIFIATLVFFGVYEALMPIFGNHAIWLAFLLFLALRGILQTFWASKTLFNLE